MNRDTAKQITEEYVKPVYGFALKCCARVQDAEDLTQDIILKVYHTLIIRDDIDSVSKFIWTIAHNALANYYRGKQRAGIGIPIHDVHNTLPSDEDISSNIIESETTSKLHQEIAYLSKLQRKIIIAYFYENKKQNDIAKELCIPLGTVKWHLFEAKKDLKKGMETMRQSGELKFNPIKFEICGTNGSIGTKGFNSNFFRSALSQNIEYAVWKEAKTINEIADILGVSPVYVESEAEYLYEYGFLTKKGEKYLCNILIEEATDKINKLHSEMYEKAARLFANQLYDQLLQSEILDDEKDIVCKRIVDVVDGTPVWEKDKNFMLWSLIPYIAAFSGDELMDTTVKFEDASTIRGDGGQNICSASVLDSDIKTPMYFESMKNWCGPCWNSNDDYVLWQVDSEWSEKRVGDDYQKVAKRVLDLFSRYFSGDMLSQDEYVYLAERGYFKTCGKNDDEFKANSQIVQIRSKEAAKKLISIGDRIKEKHKNEFDELKAPYIKAVLEATPKHLHKMQRFGLQYIFYSDGWFLLHCLKELVNNGKLKLPTEEQKKSLTTIIVPNN